MMSTKAASKEKVRRTTTVPVTTMEEIPVLCDKERNELLKSLKAAQGRVKSGKGVDYDSVTFKKRLVRIYRGAKP